MSPTVEFFFDYGSPYSYLADRRLLELRERSGVEVAYRPMLLGGVFKATGNRSPAEEPVEAKRRYGGLALRRAAEAQGTPLRMNPHFPVNTLMLMRTAIAAQQEGVFERYHEVVYPAFWREGLDLAKAEVLADLLDAAGLDAVGLAELRGQDPVKHALRLNTEEAVARGAFGAPTFFVGDEIFFGVDHFSLLERAFV